MAEQNINSNYLNSEAVANFTQSAEWRQRERRLATHPSNGQLSIKALSDYMNKNIAEWFNPPYLTTIDQINSELSQGINPENLAHFQVHYVLGRYLLSATSRQDLRENVTYNEIITRFNQKWVPTQCPMCHEPSYKPMKVVIWCSNYHQVCAKCVKQLVRPIISKDTEQWGNERIECPVCKELIPYGRTTTSIHRGWGLAWGNARKVLEYYNIPTSGQNISGGRTRRKRKGGQKLENNQNLK